jgi:hypothetical protein
MSDPPRNGGFLYRGRAKSAGLLPGLDRQSKANFASRRRKEMDGAAQSIYFRAVLRM